MKGVTLPDSLEVLSGKVVKAIGRIEASFAEKTKGLNKAAGGLSMAQAFDHQLKRGHAEIQQAMQERERRYLEHNG